MTDVPPPAEVQPADPVALAAATLTTLQDGPTRSAVERTIRDLLLSFTGADLTRLKNTVDAGGDTHDLLHLLWDDVDDPTIRAEILAHFQAQATPTGDVKVLSDIDDTFYANWVDTSFPKKTVYPGVRQLYVELDRGAADPPARGNLSFLTARPGFLEDATLEMFTAWSLHPVVLSGSLRSVTSNAAIAERKYETFVKAMEAWPEYAFVWIGDSGQGDVLLADRLRRDHPDRVRAAFIHDVVATPAAEREAWRSHGVWFFDTYVGAAVDAFRLGLLSADGLTRVARAAWDETRAVPFVDDAQRAARMGDLGLDLDAADRLLPGGTGVVRE